MTFLTRLRPRERRAVLFGAATIATIVLGTKGPAFVRDLEANARAEHAQALESLRRARELRAALAPDERGRADDVRRRAELEAAALDVRSESEGHSQMAQRVAQLAGFAGAQVLESAPIPGQAFDAGAGEVTMRFQLTTSSDALFTLLRELELGPTMIRVRRLRLVQPNPGADASVPDVLRIELELVALTRTSAQGKRT